MTLKEQLMEDLREAMRSGDELRRDTLRMVRTAIKNAEMARVSNMLEMIEQDDPRAHGVPYDEIRQRRKMAAQYEELADDESLQKASAERAAIGELLAPYSELDSTAIEDVLRKEIKQRRDSAEAYKKANRPTLEQKETNEIAIIEAYLPKQMSVEEIEAEVREVVAQVGSKEMSKVMPAVMQRLRGRAEGRVVNQVVTRVLAE